MTTGNEYLRRAYRVARLIDQGLGTSEIEARTKTPHAEIENIREWLRPSKLLDSSPQDRPTAREMTVLHCVREHMEEGDSDFPGPSTKEIADAFGIRTEEAQDALDSVVRKGLISGFPELERSSSGEDSEDRLVHPTHWEGPASTLVGDLMLSEPTDGDQEDMKNVLLYTVLRERTLRILLEKETFLETLEDAGIRPRSRTGRDVSWPSQDDIYVEIDNGGLPMPMIPPAPEGVGTMHGMIIFHQKLHEEFRGVAIAITHGNWAGAKLFKIDNRTSQVTGPNGEPFAGDEEIASLIGRLADLLTTEDAELAEWPLTRSQQRRIAKAGHINAWHVLIRKSTV